MRRIVTAAAFGLAIGLGSAKAQPVGLGTSPQGTLTYAIGAAVAKVLGETGNIQSRVQPSSGTGTMIPLVNSGEIDFGFANTLELYDAFHGVGTFDKRPNPKLRTVGGDLPDQGRSVRAHRLPDQVHQRHEGQDGRLRLHQPGNHQEDGRRHAGDRRA